MSTVIDLRIKFRLYLTTMWSDKQARVHDELISCSKTMIGFAATYRGASCAHFITSHRHHQPTHAERYTQFSCRGDGEISNNFETGRKKKWVAFFWWENIFSFVIFLGRSLSPTRARRRRLQRQVTPAAKSREALTATATGIATSALGAAASSSGTLAGASRTWRR